jgi:acetoin utilization deacetylase AcuC-like enzyme
MENMQCFSDPGYDYGGAPGYVAGSDPYKDDPLGSLQLTKPGLLARDQRVARFAREQRCPLVALPAGGYSSDSPSITAATFRALAEIEAMGEKEEGNL